VLDNWLYAADDEGIVYAYNVLGVANTAPETGLGVEFNGPTPPDHDPDGSDYSKLRVSVTTRKEDADMVLAAIWRPIDSSRASPTRSNGATRFMWLYGTSSRARTRNHCAFS
jgi:hypothetical protein